MTNTACQEMLATLAELKSLFPEMRFGQLIANLATEARGLDSSAVWEMEDVELLAAAKSLLVETRDRRSNE